MRTFWNGVAAGVAFLVTELLGRVAFGVPTIPELLQDRLVQHLPGPLFSLLLDRLLYLGKPLFFGGLLALQLLLAGLFGLALQRGRPLIWCAVLWLLNGVAVLPLAGHGLFAGSLGVAAVTLAAFAAYGAAFLAYGGQVAAASTAAVSFDTGRRRLLGSAVGVAASFLLARRAIGRLPSLVPPGSGALRGASAAAAGQDGLPAGVSPAVTPTPAFYVVSKNLADPVVAADSWKLRLDGLVDRPLELRYAELLALPAREEYRTLECISNEIGGDLMSNGLWTATPLAALLERAGVKPGAQVLHFTAADGYTENMPLQKGLDASTLLAYKLNGEPLPGKHGFPLRVLGTGTYGMKNPKWLTRVEVAATEQAGFWEQQGWNEQAVVQTMSRIDTPQDGTAVGGSTVGVGGVAFAGARGIRQVEVSTDGGGSWEQARLVPPLGPYTWVQWSYAWHPPQTGVYTLAVRATDGGGTVQPSRRTDTYPDGATGYSQVRVRVTG